MVRVNKLRGIMVEQNVSVNTLAKECNVHESTVYRWFENPDTITCINALKMRDAMNMTDGTFMDVFFASEVA